MNVSKVSIRDLDEAELFSVLNSFKQPAFRNKQILEWLWKKGVEEFSQMTNLPASFIEELDKNFYIDKIKIFRKQQSLIDQTIKILFSSLINDNFEGVLIPDKRRTTACISTQVGCALNCDFCATGKHGFKRNLSKGEIYDQVLILNELSENIFGRKLSNIVVMGMGEPLLNYENTISALKIVISENGLGMSPQRITISTAGIVPGIKSLADNNLRVNLSISLHSADNNIRNNLMPINKKYNLEHLKEAIKYFYEKTGQRITYEYLLLKDVNDKLEDASKLVEFTKICPCKINLIIYNNNEKSKYVSSTELKIKTFYDFLASKNLVVTIRKSKGSDIDAACGQLANKSK